MPKSPWPFNSESNVFSGSRRTIADVVFGGLTTGTSTAVGATTLTDSGASWGTTQYVGKTVFSLGSKAVIVSHTSTVLTFASWTGGTPATGVYTIGAADIIGPGGTYNIVDCTNLAFIRSFIPFSVTGLAGTNATIAAGTTVTNNKFIAATTATSIGNLMYWQNTSPAAGPIALVAACKDILVESAYITLTIATADITAGELQISLINDPHFQGAVPNVLPSTGVLDIS